MEKPEVHIVEGHFRSEGTWIDPYIRTNPNNTSVDNLSTDVDSDGISGYHDPHPTSYDPQPAEFEGVELVESIGEADIVEYAAGGAIGGGLSFAFYKALKEFLSLEGARQRGEISTSEVIERVMGVAWDAGKQGLTVGLILGVAVAIFGSWLLAPLALIAPFAGIRMLHSLVMSYWNGLNYSQKEELRILAKEAGHSIESILA